VHTVVILDKQEREKFKKNVVSIQNNKMSVCESHNLLRSSKYRAIIKGDNREHCLNAKVSTENNSTVITITSTVLFCSMRKDCPDVI